MELDRWFEGFSREMDDFLRAHSPFASEGSFGAARAPPIDIMETENEVIVTAELPGVEKDQVEIEIRDDRLHISGNSRSEMEEDDEGYWYRERGYSAFRRVIRLPEGLETEKASAKLNNGVLEVTIPYEKEKKRKARRIPIN
jgi:HSP20 family protein